MVGQWIRDFFLANNNRPSWAHGLYVLYKFDLQYKPLKQERVIGTPPRDYGEPVTAAFHPAKTELYRRKSSRRVCSYGKFRIYMSILRRRGLIEYTEEERPGVNPALAPRKMLRAVAENLDSVEWKAPLGQ